VSQPGRASRAPAPRAAYLDPAGHLVLLLKEPLDLRRLREGVDLDGEGERAVAVAREGRPREPQVLGPRQPGAVHKRLQLRERCAVSAGDPGRGAVQRHGRLPRKRAAVVAVLVAARHARRPSVTSRSSVSGGVQIACTTALSRRSTVVAGRASVAGAAIADRENVTSGHVRCCDVIIYYVRRSSLFLRAPSALRH